MNRCLITYQEISDGVTYSPQGLRLLSPRLRHLQTLEFSAEEQRREAVTRAAKMSIQGVQPKLSAQLNVRLGGFILVDEGGEYILKPQNEFPELPENEDLTMKLAAASGIDVPVHGLLLSRDTSRTYFIKRFDRAGTRKFALEDFAQLTEGSRETKYDSSMEKVAAVIERFCTFPVLEKVKLFHRTLFSYLAGNEDMHLKNFSLLTRDGKTTLSPAYDLVNSIIVLPGTAEEMALPITGKKRNLTRHDLVDYFGHERLRLNSTIVARVLQDFHRSAEPWQSLITASFLSEGMKRKYRDVLAGRWKVLFGSAPR